MPRAERETLGVVFCLRVRELPGQSRPIRVSRSRTSLQREIKARTSPAPSLLGKFREELNIGNEALESSVDSTEANLSELINKDGRRSPNILDVDSGRRSARGEFFNVLFYRLCVYFSLAKIFFPPFLI